MIKVELRKGRFSQLIGVICIIVVLYSMYIVPGLDFVDPEISFIGTFILSAIAAILAGSLVAATIMFAYVVTSLFFTLKYVEENTTPEESESTADPVKTASTPSST